MARTELVIAAPPESVWQVLAEPWHYGEWVVGSSEIRAWDPDWPDRGTRFEHSVGVAPLTVSDHTESLDAEPPHRLVLRAKARPLGAARVEISVEPHPAGSLVTLTEDPELPRGGALVTPPMHALIRLRNGESLRRLRRLAERRLSPADERDRERTARAGG